MRTLAIIPLLGVLGWIFVTILFEGIVLGALKMVGIDIPERRRREAEALKEKKAAERSALPPRLPTRLEQTAKSAVVGVRELLGATVEKIRKARK